MSIGLGVNAWVWTSPFTDDSAELIGQAAQMGFEVFEIPVEDPGHFVGDRVVRELQRTGMKPICCGVFGPDRDLTHDSEGPRRATLDYLRNALQLCERWGAKVICGPAYSGVGKRRPLSPDQRRGEWDRAVVGLRAAGRMAADAGVVLAIEPLNRFETDLINTCEQAVRMVEEVGLQSVRIHLDTFHMNIEERSFAGAIAAAGTWLAHVHACENDRGAPGSGLIPWPEVAAALRSVGYGGDVVIESFTPECKALAAAAAVWRPLAPTQTQLAADGLRFLQSLFRPPAATSDRAGKMRFP
jgi:D-psicose/D-tagatose/L-ribulose 3-epimerase